MKTTLTTNEVIRQLMMDDNANWTREQAEFLAEYYEQLEQELEEEIELDVVAIRCEWTRYDSLELMNEDNDSIDLEYEEFEDGSILVKEM